VATPEDYYAELGRRIVTYSKDGKLRGSEGPLAIKVRKSEWLINAYTASSFMVLNDFKYSDLTYYVAIAGVVVNIVRSLIVVE
jgi:hypothetical protein